ncbi:Ig-like domain-containing protein [Candidatus Saccharibacteria bacterium]|nr:Ig-like domain-containing protein [Candidatus Saccharibacteria bacterium]
MKLREMFSKKIKQPVSMSKKRKITIISLISGVVICIFFATFFLIRHFSSETQIIVYNIEPTKIENGILSPDSHFKVFTSNGSIEKLQKALYLEPAIDYEIKEISASEEYEVVPVSELSDNTLFNLDYVGNDVVKYKWAFQTKKDLSVSQIYPANGANYVSRNSIIEIAFSYPQVADVDQHFEISPAIQGHFETTDRTWRFIPDSELAADTVYDITITSGLTYGEEIMQKDFHSSFSTFSRAVSATNATNHSITLDGVSTFTEQEKPVIILSDSDAWAQGNSIKVTRISSADDFIKHLKGENVASTTVGTYTFTRVGTEKQYDEKMLALDTTLPTGYYILALEDNSGRTLLTMDTQINNLAAYAFESERDVVVWAAKDGALASGINVNYKGKNYQTGENGLLTLDDISNYSEQLEYLKVGNDDTPLVFALTNFKNNLYPRGYIYTDRPLYKSTDTIKVWGYIPLSFFADEPNLKNFNLTFGELKQSVSVEEDGTFSAEIRLDSFKDLEAAISLTYNDTEIASRYISVENYSLNNYTYKFNMEKNYVLSGENIEFDIEVAHITGFPAVNKDIIVTVDSHDYYASTNSYGIAHFSLPTERTLSSMTSRNILRSESIEVKSAGVDYGKYSNYTTVYIFKTNLEIKDDNINKDTNSINLTAQNIALDTNTETNRDMKNLIRSDYSGNATVTFYEVAYTRYITGYYLDQYTKEYHPSYRTYDNTRMLYTNNVSFSDGRLSVQYPTSFKDPTENSHYSYYAVVSAVDSLGRPSYSYNIVFYSNNYLGEKIYQSDTIWDLSSNHVSLSSEYNLYRFGLKDTTGSSPYSLDSILHLSLYNSSGETVKNSGQVLAIVYKENILKTEIFSNDTLALQFNSSVYPGAKIAGAYFTNGKFHRISPSYYDYKTDDSVLNVAIETDEETYEPGDTVKAKVIVTDQFGNRVKNGKINISVVNEAIFNSVGDSTDFAAAIYSNKRFKEYSFSTYRDYELTLYGGLGGGGGGSARSNFGDTLFFEEKAFSKGECAFEFKLNDSITSFRITVHAVDPSEIINVGIGTKKISSFLPLSITSVQPKNIKNTDDAVFNASSPVAGSNNVEYTFTIQETGQTLVTSAHIGETATVNFGKLELGQYNLIISGKDEAGNEDAMTFPFSVVETAQEVSIKKTIPIDKKATIAPAKNPIVVELYNKETHKYLEYLDLLKSNFTARLDTQIAYYKAVEYTNKYYSEETTSAKPNLSHYLDDKNLLKYLDNSEGDRVLTALSNYYASDYFDLKSANYGVSLSDDEITALGNLLILASFKSPVLLDLNAIDRESLSDEGRQLLALAYAFIGDYNSASEIYANLGENTDTGIRAILASFISKSDAAALIDGLIANDETSAYLRFAIISFFENNEADLETEEKIEVKTSSSREEIALSGLTIAKRVLYMADLSDLEFKTRSNDLFATYYYQGRISELSDNYSEDLSIRLEGDKIANETATLVIDVSTLSGETRNGELNIALPSSLKFSATFSAANGLYLSRNNNEYVKLNLSERYQPDEIRIPLYVATSGNYEIEPIVFVEHGIYHISNSVVVDLD